MSKIYSIKDLISLNNYSKKYNVSLRKIYRHIGDMIVEHYIIDGVAFLPDEPISILKEHHTRNQLQNSVKNLTEKTFSVKILTQYLQTIENQEVNSDKILTESSNSVKILTLTENELRLIASHDDKLSKRMLNEKYELIKKYLKN